MGVSIELDPAIAPKCVEMEHNGVVKQVRGRPVKFDQPITTKDFRGKDGQRVVPILYESQCPWCGVRLNFSDKLKSIKCPHCGKGEDKLEKDDFFSPFCEPGQYDAFPVNQ